MKFKDKSKLIFLLSTLAIVSQFAVGFGSWIIIDSNLSLQTEINSNLGSIVNGIDGIEISNVNDLKIGKYFYYENGNSVKNGSLNYTFSVNPSLLADTLKNENENGGYTFTLNGILALSNNLNVFDDNSSYLISTKFNDIEINFALNGINISFSLEFATNSKENTLESFNLTFELSNMLIIEHKNDILNQHFVLTIGENL